MINLEPIPKIIQKRMFEKMQALRDHHAPPNATNDGSLTFDKMASKTSFLRMTSGQTNAVILMGGTLKDDGGLATGYDEIYGPRTYKTGGTKGSGTEQELTQDLSVSFMESTMIPTGRMTGGTAAKREEFKNDLKRPMPGLKSAEVSYKGGTKAIREASISWTCWDFNELNFLTPHFLAHGKTVMLEWGWVYDKSTLSRLPSFIQEDMAGNRYISNDAFTNYRNKILDAEGDFDMMVGIIKNFEFTTREDGAFDCTTDLTSIGVNMFENPLPNDSVMDPSITYNLSEEDLKNPKVLEKKLNSPGSILAIDSTTSLKFFIENMDDYVLQTVNGDVENRIPAPVNNAKLTGIADKYIIRLIGETRTVKIDSGAKGRAARETQEIIEVVGDVWVRWGWFEDNVLSKFLSVTTVAKDTIMTQFRSIENIPIKNGGGKLSGKYESTKIRNHEKLETIDINNHILPGQFFPQEPKSYVNGTLTGDDQFLLDLKKMIDENFTPFATETDISPKAEEYTVKPGDSLSKIATLYEGVTYQDIQKANDIVDESVIKIDQKLKIPDQTKKKSSKYGYLRNILINTKVIKQVFGADGSALAEPINVFEAIQQLFDKLNEDLDFWNFDIVIDELEDYRAKIIDKDTTHFDFKKGSPFQQQSKIDASGNVFSTDAAGGKQGEGVFFFPVWRIDSFIKSQNISTTVPNSMQLAVMYGSNTDQMKEFSNPGGGFAEKTGVLMGGLNNESGKDESKQGLDIAYRNLNSRNIGTKSGNPSQPFTINGGDDIFSFLRANSSNLKEGYQNKINKLKSEQTEAQTEVVEVLKKAYDDSVPVPLIGMLPDDKLEILLGGGERVNPAISHAKFLQLFNSKFSNGRMKDAFIETIGYYTTLTGEQRQAERSMQIPLDIELTVDGIGGIYPGNSFHSTYLPQNYQTKALFQMFEVSHTIDSSGWSVTFNGKMRATANSIFNKFQNLDDKLKKQLDQMVVNQGFDEGNPSASPTPPAEIIDTGVDVPLTGNLSKESTTAIGNQLPDNSRVKLTIEKVTQDTQQDNYTAELAYKGAFRDNNNNEEQRNSENSEVNLFGQTATKNVEDLFKDIPSQNPIEVTTTGGVSDSLFGAFGKKVSNWWAGDEPTAAQPYQENVNKQELDENGYVKDNIDAEGNIITDKLEKEASGVKIANPDKFYEFMNKGNTDWRNSND